MTPAIRLDSKNDGVILYVRAQPRAAREGVQISADGSLRIAIPAPPVDNAANTALCAYIAKLLAVRKSRVSLVSGEHSRNKKICVHGVSTSKVIEKFALVSGKC